MLRGGEFSNNRYGRDPFVTLRDERKAILEFDLSKANPNVVYEYTLQFFVTFVAKNNVRADTASHITQQDYTWSDVDVMWNNFGTPALEEIGWFSIFRDDSESLVVIPLGMLENSTIIGNRLILILETRAEESGEDKFDFCSKPSGLVHAFALGTMLWTALGWRGWTICVAYLFLGKTVMKVGFDEKELHGIAEGRGGRRGPENVWGSALTDAM